MGRGRQCRKHFALTTAFNARSLLLTAISDTLEYDQGYAAEGWCNRLKGQAVGQPAHLEFYLY